MLAKFSRKIIPVHFVCSRGIADLTIYGFPLSQPTRSVLMLCKENNIPFSFKLVDALKGENRKPEFRKFHPAGLLPAISVGNDFVLGESAAILEFLSDSNGLEKWYPRDLKQRALVNFWLHWNHANTRMSTKNVLVSKLFPPKTEGGTNSALQEGVQKLSKSVAFIEDHFGRTNCAFLVGDSPTIADLLIITELDQQLPEAFGLFDFSPFPLVSKWMKECQKISSYKEVFEPVIQIAKKVLKRA
jgi:glutathione S-transferase